MRVRDDWPGSLCMMALTGWLGACGGLALFTQGGQVVAVAVLLASAPFIGVACMVFTWMYWRRHPEIPRLSRVVVALGLLLFVLGVTGWWMAIVDATAEADEQAEMEQLEVTPEERAQMEAQDAFEEAKLELSKARADTQRAEAALLEAREAPAVREVLDAGGAK